MGTLYVDRKDVELRHQGACLLVYEQGTRTGSVPFSHLDRVVLYGRAHLDTGLLGALAEHGIGLVAINPRKRSRTVHIPGCSHNDASRRLAQYLRTQDEDWRVRWSMLLVVKKIRGQQRMLARALERRPDQRYTLTRAIRALEDRQVALRESAHSRDRIRGLEGAAAAAYFGGYCSLFPPVLEFNGRNRRPPKDPVNACLSLAYTLAHADAVQAIHAAGLDPMLGFYHDVAFGRESLACDLIEPLRPCIDDWVWSLFRERQLRADDFSLDKGACLLGKAGRKTFYTAWEQSVTHNRRRLRRYARLLVHALQTTEVGFAKAGSA